MQTHYVHRGLIKRKLAENTIESFKKSTKKGYGIETDLHITKDKQIVCFHDFNLKRKFKKNKQIKKINYDFLVKLSKRYRARVPLLKDLLKISKNKYPLLLEIKPTFNKESLKILLKLLRKTKKYGIISFREKNLTNLYKINSKLPLGLLFNKTANLKTIKFKAKKKYVKFLVLDKIFLANKKLHTLGKKNYFYTIKSKNLFKKYNKFKNLIFERK
tara:strand:- start:1600 stop:2247 length:648 start_codon:yes stop_codon:yes gene_type:complete